MFSPTFFASLDALCAQHGVARSLNGNKITLVDVNGVEDAGKQALRLAGHYYGLSEADYGAVFTSQGRRFKLIGVKPSRPKYPLQCESLGDGRVFKFGTHVVPMIVAQRATQPAPAAVATAKPNMVLNPPPPEAMADLTALAGMPRF